MANYSGKYDKRRLLGRGTFGEAWLVVSNTTFYVMKEMVTGAWDNKDKEQAMNEVNILASCNHVNIVRYAGAYIVHKNLMTEKFLIIMESIHIHTRVLFASFGTAVVFVPPMLVHCNYTILYFLCNQYRN